MITFIYMHGLIKHCMFISQRLPDTSKYVSASYQMCTFVNYLCFYQRLGAFTIGLRPSVATTNIESATTTETNNMIQYRFSWHLDCWQGIPLTCRLFWAAPAIFTFQKTHRHSCLQAAVTLGLLWELRCVCACVCVTVVVRGSAELRLQLGFGGRKKKCILLIQDRSMCQILREIGEELWCDGIAVFECP